MTLARSCDRATSDVRSALVQTLALLRSILRSGYIQTQHPKRYKEAQACADALQSVLDAEQAPAPCVGPASPVLSDLDVEKQAFEQARAASVFGPPLPCCPVWYATLLREEGWKARARWDQTRADQATVAQAGQVEAQARAVAVGPSSPSKNERAYLDAIRMLTEQCAALVNERDELQKKVWRHESSSL